MTNSPPVPPDNQSPYPIAEPPHPHQHRPTAAAVDGGAGIFAPALIAGAVIAGAAVIAGTVFALFRLHLKIPSAGGSPAKREPQSPGRSRSGPPATGSKRAGTSDAKVRAKGGRTTAKASKARARVKAGPSTSGDDTSERGPRDASRIAMGEDYEVRYWTHKFGVDREALQRAVDAVGNGAEAVEQELGKS